MPHIAGDRKDRPYVAMIDIGCIDATAIMASGRIAFARAGINASNASQRGRSYDAVLGIVYIDIFIEVGVTGPRAHTNKRPTALFAIDRFV